MAKSSRESALQTKIVKYLICNDIFHHVNHGNMYVKKGLPDIEACVQGKYVAMELKRKGHKREWSDVQKIVSDEIKRSGGICWLIDTYDEFEKNMEKLIK